MFDKTRTWCFGRYLVDVPREAELKYQSNNYAVAKINSEFDVRKFRAMVNETLEKRKNVKDIYEYSRSEYPEDSVRQIIVSMRNLWGHVAYAVDAFTLNPKYKPGSGYFFYLSGTAYPPENIDGVIEKYRNILSSVRYRFEDEIPQEPGFCFESGFVENDGKTSQPEYNNSQFRLKDHPDVLVTVVSSVHWIEEKPLLERFKGIEKLFRGGEQIISAKAREINGLDGEEFLVSYPTRDKTGQNHLLRWETLGEIGNPLKPGIFLDIQTGHTLDGGTVSSLTTSEVRALYEAIVKTIRIRPTTGAKPAPHPPGEAKP
jgi:hypothetical protein